jgi:hypothetical protein
MYCFVKVLVFSGAWLWFGFIRELFGLICMASVYMVLINEGRARVLVTGRSGDAELTGMGWRIAGRFKTWREAYEEARTIADQKEYILEWYLEEETTT